MRTVSLGNTGAEVSVFCLGTMHFGSRTDKETSYRLLDQYVEAGGSFLDTANNYAMWVLRPIRSYWRGWCKAIRSSYRWLGLARLIS